MTEAHGWIQDRRYRLREPLGSGAMSRVFAALDRRDGGEVALKVAVRPSRADGSPALEREYECRRSLAHPNVVRCFGYRIAEHGPLPSGSAYLVLERVRGRALDRAFPDGTISNSRWLSLATQTLAALTYLHRRGWVHRDLKPGNLLVDDSRLRIRLTDFGLATPVGTRHRPGCISGSPAYVAPEVPDGLPAHPRSDLYALGILLFQLATGRLPQPDLRLPAVLRWHRDGPQPIASELRPDFPRAYCRWIGRLANRDPHARPETAAEALSLLTLASRLETGSGAATRPPATALDSACPG